MSWPKPGICGAAWHFLKIQWFFLVHYLFGNWWISLKPATKFYHKVLIMGDSVAAGFGDYITCVETPGVARHLSEFISKEHTVRQRWKFINVGVFGSTSDDWNPECKHGNQSLRSYGYAFGTLDKFIAGERSPLWRQILSDPRYSDASIVILCVGLEDNKYGSEPRNPARTLSNIKAIVSSLRAKGMLVIVNTIPLRWRLRDVPKDSNTRSFFDFDEERNQLILDYVRSSSDKDVMLGCDLGRSKFDNPDFYTADAVHFNSDGYRKFASEVRSVLVPALVRVEAQTWKELL